MSYNGNTLNLGLGLNNGALPAGELRRLYAFGNQVSELAVAQTPFFRLLSKYSKSPVNDPEFKGLEQRHQWQRRYLFVQDIHDAAEEVTVGGLSKTVVAGVADDGAGAAPNFTGTLWGSVAAGAFLQIKWATDYKDTGEWNKNGTMYNTAASCPEFIQVGQIINVPVMASDVSLANNDVTSKGQLTVKILSRAASSGVMDTIVEVIAVDELTSQAGALDAADVIYVGSPGVTNSTTSDAGYNPAGGANMPTDSISGAKVDFVASVNASTEDAKCPRERRCYISGTAFAEGSGMPDSWKDKAFVDTYGYTQIFKTTATMNYTAQATVLRGVPNEWARMWKERLIEHKRDIELACLFGEKHKTEPAGGDPVRYMQGAIPYIKNSGQVFDFQFGNVANSKTFDGFIDDLGEFMHPEKGDVSSTVYMCPTNMFSYLSKVGTGGFAHKSLDGSALSTFQTMNVKTVAGLPLTQIATPHGTINLVKNVQLDGSNVKILGINLKHVKYRPLVGNGLNRDTSIYVGVNSLENTGTDKRVDLIQTEAGLDWGMPEAHAVWL